MWTKKSGLQAQELALLQQLKQQQDVKASLRTQLLEKQNSLLKLGITISRRSCRCPVQVHAQYQGRLSVILTRWLQGCSASGILSLAALRSHLSSDHGSCSSAP
jgi:hypothetical protein